MRVLVWATATMGSAMAAAILLKMVGAKIVASVFGPPGVGIYAQLLLLADFGAALSALGLSAGVVRYASQFRSSENWAKLRSLESTLLFTLLPYSLVVGAGAILFSQELSRVFLGRSDYALAVSLIALSWPLVAIALLAESLTSAAKQVRFRAIALVANAAAGVAFLALLVPALGILGAGLSVVATAAFQFTIAWYFASRLTPRQPLVSRLLPKSYELGLFVKLFQYGIASLSTTAIVYLSLLMVRTSIVMQLGTEANGLYQVVWASQASWPTVLLSAFSSYFYPSYCEAKDTQSRCEQFNRIVRLMLLLSTPLLGVFVLFRSEVVLLLYTPQFLPAASLLGVSLLFGLFSILSPCLSLPFLAAGKLRALIAITLFRQSFFVAGSYLLLPVFQLHGVVYAAGSALLLSTLFSLAYARQKLDIRLSYLNAKTLLLSMVLVAAILALSELNRAVGFAASPFLFLAWAHQVLGKPEVDAIRHLLRFKAKMLPADK